MGSTSVFGTRRAGLIAAWLILIAYPARAEREASATLDLQITGLRNSRGMVHLCVSPSPEAFPHCRATGRGRTLSLRATAGHRVTIPALRPGIYAVALIHDENGNGELDTVLGVPREGFAFSNNPPIGRPNFARSTFILYRSENRQHLQVRYLL